MSKLVSVRLDGQTLRELEMIIEIEKTKVAPGISYVINQSSMIISGIETLWLQLLDNHEVNDRQYNYVYQVK